MTMAEIWTRLGGMFDPKARPNLPPVIILYGPPGSGKGTQAQYLKELLPSYAHLDFGTELRTFVETHLPQQAETDTQEMGEDQEITKAQRAQRIQLKMLAAQPVLPEDLQYVVESVVTENISQGKGLIMEGPGRMEEEAEWLAGFFAQQGIHSCIIHLHLTLEDIIPRLTTRFYIPGNSHPFVSYEEALRACTKGELPYRRQDDIDVNKIIDRYHNLYKEKFAGILFIYQLKAGTDVLIFDAAKSIPEVAKNIETSLHRFYSF